VLDVLQLDLERACSPHLGYLGCSELHVLSSVVIVVVETLGTIPLMCCSPFPLCRLFGSHFQVIPFLALAVGVDNMFMLVYALQRQVRGPGVGRGPSALSST
jgi:hypothetical protein